MVMGNWLSLTALQKMGQLPFLSHRRHFSGTRDAASGLGEFEFKGVRRPKEGCKVWKNSVTHHPQFMISKDNELNLRKELEGYLVSI